MEQIKIVQQIVEQFCLEFIDNPYLCYTEHGLHALFYTRLYNALPAEQRFTTWQGNQVCVIQKEYSTAGNLGKSKRQHWDIAVIQTPPQSIKESKSYDYLKLAAVVEFGMNANKEHLIGDIERLCHTDANLAQGFIVHLYRLSKSDALFSGRDKSSNSALLTKEDASELSANKAVEIYYGIHDSTGKHESGLWLIKQGTISSLK